MTDTQFVRRLTQLRKLTLVVIAITLSQLACYHWGYRRASQNIARVVASRLWQENEASILRETSMIITNR